MSTTDADESNGQLTAENRSVEVEKDALVYRSFGDAQTDAPPLLCLKHFRGAFLNGGEPPRRAVTSA